MTPLKNRINTFAQVLAADPGLTAWALSAYGRKPKVFINIDTEKPPGEEHCPYVLLYPESARFGNAQNEKLSTLTMVCALYDAGFRTYADGDIVEYAGVQNLLDLMQLAVRALAAVDLGNELLSVLEPVFDTIDSFPFFLAGLPLAISGDYVLGSDRLEL
jgi:hypothetical protein